MRPVEFTQDMQVMRGDGGAIGDLPVLAVEYMGTGPALISCWQMSFGDLLRLLLGGLRVYVTVLGTIHPPITLAAEPPVLATE